MVKSNVFKMLPWEKETYCFAVKKCQPTVFVKVGSDSSSGFLKPLQFNYKPFDVLRCILKVL